MFCAAYSNGGNLTIILNEILTVPRFEMSIELTSMPVEVVTVRLCNRNWGLTNQGIRDDYVIFILY